MRHFNCGFDSSSSISLESQLDMLALESNVLANVIETFRSIVPDLTAKISETYHQLIAEDSEKPTEAVKEIRSLTKKASLHAASLNYVTFKNTLVSVPEGFRGNLLEYLQLLNRLSADVFDGANKILGDYNFVLSSFLTNKENKVSLKDHTDLFHRVQKRREQLTADIAGFFPGKNDLTKATLGSVIERFGEIDAICSEFCKLDGPSTSGNIKEIANGVKKSIDLLNLVISSTEEDGAGAVSGASALNISKGAYEIGKYVEFVAIFRYKIDQASATVISLLKKVAELG